MTVILLVILVLAVLFIIALGMRASHLVEQPSRQPQPGNDDLDPFGELGDYPEFPGFDEEFGDQPQAESDELVDLVDYFAEEEEEPVEPPQEAAAQARELPQTVEEAPQADFDRLCQLPTGRGFLAQCQNQLSLSAQGGQPYALIYFDYDRFRFINSLKGFSIGDYALQKTVQEMRAIFPEGAMFTRLSADHFMVLFPYNGEEQLEEYTDNLRRAAERIRGDIGAKSGLKLCMGVSLTDSAPESYDVMALLLQANIARHCLKITKRDSAYSLFDPSMIDSFLLGESALEDYTENQYNDEFEIYFQPIYSLSAGRIGASEALARWIYEDNNTEEPPAVDSGKLPTNNLKVIYHTFKAMSRWRREGYEVVPVMVNLPILDLYKQDIDAFFARCLSEFQIEPKMVTAVVDLHTVGLHWPMAETQLGKLKEFGMSVAVSGIERGITGVDFLAGLPIRYVKMHQSVAQDVGGREDRQMMAQALIQSARQCGFDTVFEGVDYSTSAAWLKQEGAGMAEGSYAGIACTADEFARTLQEHLKMQRTQVSSTTLVLDDEALAKGNYRVY